MPASAISVTGQIFKVQESPSILPLDDDDGDYDYYDDSRTKMRTPSQRQQQSGHYESGMATTSPPPDYGTPETQGMSPMENDPDLEEPGRIISNRSGSRPPSNPEERLPSNLHSKFENVTKKSAPPIDTKQRNVMENQSDDSNDTNNKEDSKGAPRRSRRPNFYIGAAVAIFVIAIVTVVSVLLTSDLRDDGTTILDPDELELVPTSPVSPAPTIHLTPTSSPALTSPTTATETPVSPSASPIGTASPTESPTTVAPTAAPVATPTVSPTAFPTSSPTTSPTGAPTALPTSAPLALPTATPTSHPTFSPTTAPVVSNVPAMQTALLDILFVNNVEVNDPAVSPNSPSALAVSWLAEEASVNGGSWFSDDQSKLIQRFAVLTLDYSLQGSSAVSSARSANVYAAMDANADYSGGSGFSDPFDRHHRNLQTTLSATMFQNECSWDGIVCNDLGYVSEIRMGSRSLAGEIPSQIGLLSSLVYLDLAQNDLTGRIPESLYDIPYLRKVYLYQNELTGTISNAIGNLRNLTYFHVSHNSLTGTIPNTMKSDTEIRPYYYINLSHNQLSGTIPDSLRWRQLFFLDLGWNQLTGTLPVDLGEKFVALRHLHLDHNGFTGPLPTSYINVGNGRLEQLSVNDNQLTGEIPADRELTNKMVMLNLENNDFSSIDKDTCDILIGYGGEGVEFTTECEFCICKIFFCLEC